MVNATEILRLIDTHKQLSLKDVAAIDGALNKMPWFSTLHLLNTKAHKNNQSTLFEGLLHKSAIYSGDRNVLYDFINDQFKDKVKTPTLNEEAADLIEKVTTKEFSIIPELEIAIPEIIKPTENEIDELNAIEEKIAIEETKAIEEKEIFVSPVEIENPTSSIPEISLEVPFINEDEEPEIDLNKHLETRIKVIYDPAVELAKLTINNELESKKEDSIPIAIAYNPEKELADYIEKPIDPMPEDGHDFTFWLDHFNQESEENQQVSKPNIRNSFDSEEGDPTVLLEKFLQNRPSISRPKAEFFNAENMARKSEEFKLDLVSESLAKLFLKQGMPEKALEIYEKLMLQNPSNNTFFAAQIEKIKNLK